MASFDYCIDQAFKSGKVTKDIAEKIKAADNPDQAIDEVLGDLSRQKREAAIQSVRIAEAMDNIKSHPEGDYDGLMALLTKDPKGKAGYANIEYLGRFYEGRYHAKLADALSRFRTRAVGFSQDKEGLENMVRAIYGETVDDADIGKFADDWHKLTEEIRQEFNAKGGSISKNERWLMPQHHDMRTVEKMGLDAWKQKIMPLLDRNNMLDDLGNRLSDEQFEESLDFVFETITSGGLNKVKDFTVPRLGKKLSRKGSDKRFLFFKDADSWLSYQKEFGKGDIFTTLTDWVDSKAHDIAVMEVLGTSPETSFNALKAQVEKANKLTGRQRMMSDAVFKVASGRVDQGELTGVADFMQTVRNLLTASTLGRAFLSSISDEGFTAITAKYNNIPAVKVIGRKLSLLNPANETDRIAAVKLGLIADAWVGRAHAANRYVDTYGTGASTKIAEGVMRASLLAPWTDAGRKAFGMEFASMLADNFGKTADQLDPNLLRAFDSYGITPDDWNVFRNQTPLDFDGGKFADMTQDAGKKFHQMVMSETDFAVPTPDARVRAITTGGLGKASIEGQAWRSAMMLKSFPITIATTHFYRAAYQATLGEKLGYLGTLVATTTVLGGIALQAKDISSGKEPRPVDPKFIAASFQQGGGLGIFGDFIFSDVNRFGGGITETLTGPTGQLIDTTVKFTLGNVREAISGEETNVLGEGVKLVKRYTPDIWQTTLFKNAIFDQIEQMADPEAARRYNRIIRKRRREYNQDYWWKPGQPLPEIVE